MNSGAILKQVEKVLYKVMADRQMGEVTLSEEMALVQDLDLESIDYVIMVDELSVAFNNRINFADWLSVLDPAEIVALKISDIVQFISSELGMRANNNSTV